MGRNDAKKINVKAARIEEGNGAADAERDPNSSTA